MVKLKTTAMLIFAVFAVSIFHSTSAKNQNDADRIGFTVDFSEPAPIIKCSIQTYRRGLHNDDVPAVTNIRSQPDKNSSIVKVISTSDEIVFSITGNSNGWFEVSTVETYGTDDDKIIFKGHGWVHSSQLDLSVAGSDPKLYAEPKKTSRVLKRLIADQSPSEPLACQGRWIKVKSGKLIGWLSPEGQCANPLTTCS